MAKAQGPTEERGWGWISPFCQGCATSPGLRIRGRPGLSAFLGGGHKEESSSPKLQKAPSGLVLRDIFILTPSRQVFLNLRPARCC